MYPPPVKSPLLSRARSRPRHGFTLIELLMVIAVIMILAGITFGIYRSVQIAQTRAKAKGELAVLAQSLEQFKAANGDYPWTTGFASSPEANAELLLQALLGWKKFGRVQGVVTLVDVLPENVPLTGPKVFIDPSKFTIRKRGSNETYVDLPDSRQFAPSGYYLADPWGHPYVYLYGKLDSTSNTWEVFGYHLYSMGPDEAQDTSVINSTTGVMKANFRDAGGGENADNIYAGE